MTTIASGGALWPSRLMKAALYLGGSALVLLAAAGPGYRGGIVPLIPALLAAAIGFLLFLIAFIIGGIAWVFRRRGTRAPPRAALYMIGIAAVATAVAAYWIGVGHSAPPIHDISTDLQNPPVFKDILPLRAAAGAVNPPQYLRSQSMNGQILDVAEAQRAAYPHLQPLVVALPPARAMELADQAAHAMKWDVVASVPTEGRIEAVDTTRYFGFKDDIVVRISPEGAGSRVDVRSESRVGLGDAGTNARRVRAYLEKLRGLAGQS